MNQQTLTNNKTDQTKDEAEVEMLLFDDLNLTEEQLAEIKGGPGGGWGCPTCDVQNHNETTVSDEEEEAESLSDLSLTGEQAEETKAGAGGGGGGAGKATFQDLHFTTKVA